MIVTIQNYGKVYEEHVGGDWWWKGRLVQLYENFYATLSFIIKRVPVGSRYKLYTLHDTA